MRMIVIEQAIDLQALTTRLLGAKAGVGAGAGASLDTLKHMNPHVDFERLGAGTVLLVPDLPGLRDGQTGSIAGQAFDTFSQQVLAGLDEAATRVQAGHAARLTDQKELVALFKGAALKRAFESDPELKAQADAYAQVFKQDPADAKAADETLKALKDGVGAELAVLTKLLG